MKNLSQYVTEAVSKKQYDDHWVFFNTLVANVKLSKDQYQKMFENLSDDEIDEWIELTVNANKGTGWHADANKMHDHVDLAIFYSKHPIE